MPCICLHHVSNLTTALHLAGKLRCAMFLVRIAMYEQLQMLAEHLEIP